MSLFSKLFNKKPEQAAQKDDKTTTPFWDYDKMTLKQFYNKEAAFRHQFITIPRFTKERPAKVQDVLDVLLPGASKEIQDCVILSIGEHQGEVRQIIKDPESVRDLRLVMLVNYRDDEGKILPLFGENCLLQIKFNPSFSTKEVFLHIRNSANYSSKAIYLRVSVLIPPYGIHDDKHSTKSGSEERITGAECCPTQTSFLLVEDLEDISNDLRSFESCFSSAMEKRKRGEEYDELEQECMEGMVEFKSMGHYIGYGKWLADQNRWFDAYRQFIRVYHMIQRQINTIPESDRDFYYHLMFSIGRCLSKLGRLDEAAYFMSVCDGKIEEAKGELDMIYARLGDIRTNKLTAPIQAFHKGEIRKDTESVYNPESLTVGAMLEALFGAVKGSLLKAIIRIDEQEEILLTNSAEETWNIPLSKLAKDKTTAMIVFSPVGYITGNKDDNSKLCRDNAFIIRAHKANTGLDDGIMRINIMIPDFVLDDEKMYFKHEHIPEGLSFVVGTKEPQNSRNRYYSDRFIRCSNLFEEKRYLEGYLEAHHIFNFLLSRWDELNENDKYDFAKVAFDSGFALMDFRLPEKGNYYLEIAAQFRDIAYMQEYINSLTNSFDVRALNVIDEFSKLECKGVSPQEIANWKAFLNRRKVYNLIEAKRYDEAKTILETLLDSNDPVTKHYAQSELDYINSLNR